MTNKYYDANGYPREVKPEDDNLEAQMKYLEQKELEYKAWASKAYPIIGIGMIAMIALNVFRFI